MCVRVTFKAKVDVIETLGRELNVHLTAGEKSLVMITSSTQDLTVGEEIWLLPDKRKIHFFDKKSGKAIR